MLVKIQSKSENGHTVIETRNILTINSVWDQLNTRYNAVILLMNDVRVYCTQDVDKIVNVIREAEHEKQI